MNLEDLVNKGILDLSPYKPGKPIEDLERELGIKNAIKLASNRQITIAISIESINYYITFALLILNDWFYDLFSWLDKSAPVSGSSSIPNGVISFGNGVKELSGFSSYSLRVIR